MNCRNKGADTDLFLVRIWKGRPEEGARNVSGKLQHVVSGAVNYFEGLSSLPDVLERMMEQETPAITPDTERYEDQATHNTLQKESQRVNDTLAGGEMSGKSLVQTKTREWEGDVQANGSGARRLEGPELAAGRQPTEDVLKPGDDGYEANRKAWNTRFDRRPALIFRCRSVEDVVRAVKVATKDNLPVAVRSGGHSPAGFSAIEGGMLIDLSLMDSLTIDADKRVAIVQPGLTWGAYSERTHRYGLATPAGDNATVGVGGLTLGGGIGWLARKYGMTIDHLLSAEVVTASGDVVRASEIEHTDLFWALRGGGGNFGIVTRFEFRLVPVGNVVGGMLVYPAEPDVIAAFARAAAEAPDELTTISEVMKTPPIPFLPQELYGKVHLLAAFCYAGDPVDEVTVQRALDALRSAGPVVAEMVAPMPYPGIFKFTEEGSARGPYSVRSHFLRTFDLDAAEVIVDATRRGTSPESMVQIRVLGGALARVPTEATAFAHRNKTYFVAAINPWTEATPDEVKQHVAWTESLWSALKPRASGAYASFQGDEGQECVEQAYPEPTYRQLARIKAVYDPVNLFRANCNIVPAVSG